MKLQYQILKTTLKKNQFYIYLLFIIAGLCLVFYELSLTQGYQESAFLSLIGYPMVSDVSFLGMILSLYQFFLIFYLFYHFYSYEVSHSFCNVFLRTNSKKWMVSKIAVFLLFLLLFRLLYISLLSLYFLGKISFSASYFIYPIVISIFFVAICILLYHFVKNKVLLLVLLIILSYTLLTFFHCIFIVLLSILLFLYHIFFFRFYYLFDARRDH